MQVYVKPPNKWHVYAVQILLVVSIFVGSQGINFDNINKWGATVARYVVYLLVIRSSKDIVNLAYTSFHSRDVTEAVRQLRHNQLILLIFGAAVGLLVYLQERILDESFPLLFIAYLIVKYPDMEKQGKISYGTGMACSFFEGYLIHVIPSDGYKFVGFEENIRVFESKEAVRFPVKRLFIIITKDMYCPPDLKEFNSTNPDLPYLESCKSLEDVKKDVAGVMNRVYRNSAYKIHRRGRSTVYVAAECATPIHTLHLVMKNRALYEDLAGIDAKEVVRDFMAMLRLILAKSPQCRNKCEVVFFDNTDPTQNLADVLLDRIREIEPKFEDIILQE